jgi:gliding motility-associated lipoprotein GldH
MEKPRMIISQARGLAFLIASMLLIGCSNSLYQSGKKDMENGVWNAEDAVAIDMEIQDTSSTFDYYIDLRNSNDYPYQNIYLFIDLVFPNGRKMVDTLSVDLAYPDGRWIGKGAGGYFDSKILYKHKKKFPLPGDYRFRIRHAMRDLELKGIETVGVEIAYVE